MAFFLSQTISVRSQSTVVNSLELLTEPVNDLLISQISMVSLLFGSASFLLLALSVSA
jgi:hypothetical protein